MAKAVQEDHSLDLLYQQVNNRAQVAALAQIRARSERRARGVVNNESASVHNGHECVQVDALHQRVPRRNGLVELVPDVLRLCHAGVLQHKPAVKGECCVPPLPVLMRMHTQAAQDKTFSRVNSTCGAQIVCGNAGIQLS